MSQGFVRNNNLSESITTSSDRGILDNLGGVNISQDILLFDGNNAFKSKLINDTTISRADFSIFDDTTDSNFKTVKTDLINNKRAFSNGTKISFNDGNDLYPYIVVDSNGLDEFRLVVAASATFPYNAGEYEAPFSGLSASQISNLTLTRQDTITITNLVNMSAPRLVTNDSVGETEDVGVSDADNDDDGGGSVGEAGGQVGIFDNFGTYDQISYVAGAVGRLEAKKTRTILTDRASFFEDRLRFKGNIRITNDSQTAIYNNSANAPGLFIYNTATGGEIRAFSGSDNPWEEATITFDASKTGLKTTSAKSQITKLVFSPDGGGSSTSERGLRPKLIKKSGSSVVDAVTHIDGNASEQLTIAAFTHKIPITVNGEQFFMLAKKV